MVAPVDLRSGCAAHITMGKIGLEYLEILIDNIDRLFGQTKEILTLLTYSAGQN